MASGSQKFIARNRAPRVQIEYDVELYGSEKKVQLPFVMGVMADLAGKSAVVQPAIADRKFLEIDVDNFDERMRAMAPRASFAVPNTLTGEGNIAGALGRVRSLMGHPGFHLDNPNRLRALIGAWATGNQTGFHRADGKGYAFFAEVILKAAALNPQVAARLATALRSWRSLEPVRRDHARRALVSIAEAPDLPVDVRDIVERTLR